MSRRPAASALLAATPLLVRRGPYALAAWTPEHLAAVSAALGERKDGHAFVVLDEREVSAFLPEDALAALPPPAAVERGFCLLTLDQTLPWDAVGVLAAVSAALARAGVPCGAVAAFSRDHLFVPAARLPPALAALAGLCAEVRVLG